MDHLRQILRHFPVLEADRAEVSLRPMAGGLINDTFAVGDDWVLQRLHPIFVAEVNHDIVALTAHLAAAGVVTPRLALASSGQPFAEVQGPRDAGVGGVWRLMGRLPGRTLHRLESPAQAASAGELVARFHAALSGVAHTFRFSRPGAHDTPAHMQALQTAVLTLPAHALYDPVAALAEQIDALWSLHEGAPSLPLRIGHGDLKASNLLFDERGANATAILDLDTMAWMTMDVELGDALRSWCNRAAEDAPTPALDVDVFAAAMRGYAGGARRWITGDERDAIVSGLLRISTELSARFAADALRECYFGWNPDVAPSRGVHNLMRARNQLQFAQQVALARPRLERLVREAFAAAA